VELDALAMANSYFNITGLAVQYGLNSALRTLCPQAVGSGRSRELNGIYVQRGVLIAIFALLPSFALAANAQLILTSLGQPPDLAALAQEYCLRLQPALVGIGLMTLLQRVMQAEGHIMANLYICLLVFACAPAIQYTLIHVMGMGFKGAAYASSAYNLLYLLFYVPYMQYAGLGHIFIPRKEAFSLSGMYGHLSLALPGLLSTLLEWASMELGGKRQLT
jgi:MATE family multidrug resistance protein